MSAEQVVREVIEGFVASSPLNRLVRIDSSPIFDAPLVGVADGYDPLFEQYKQIIGPFHLTPQELMEHAAADGLSANNNDLTSLRVICWVLPITRETRFSNRREGLSPSERWAFTRYYGEEFNSALRRQVTTWLQSEGYLAVAPFQSELYNKRIKGLDYTSPWSERHALYAAGLGTFSLNDGFITPKGMAMRCGSVITNLPLHVTPRPYLNHLSNCLFYSGSSCDACIRRCPAGAITSQGHDKAKCATYQETELASLRKRLGVGIAGCGLCQTRVPCEACIPVSPALVEQ
ncbi:MAG: 4Fe-4S binding protein [Anaerolineae bacterium]